MNIHFIAGERVPTPRGHKPQNNTKPPRTRDGATYPGGKQLRRSLKELARRKSAFANLKNPAGHTPPGAM